MSLKKCGSIGCLLFGLWMSSCVSYAVPPPLATLGGPSITPQGHSRVGLGVGSGASLFPGAHSGGHAWLGRWRIGLAQTLDLGVDLMGIQRSSNMALTGKGALSLGLSDWVRLELGLGAADDSDGKSIGAETGLVIGTPDNNAPWGFYGTLRLSGALSLTDDAPEEEGTSVGDISPNALFALGSLGASARLSDWARLIFEGGAGAIFVEGYDDTGLALYVCVGLLFDVNGKSASVVGQ